MHTILTTTNGNPVEDNQHSVTVGKNGPVLLEDFHYIDKISHFNRERIPERVVHAKGSGAFGYFEVTKDISNLTKAKFLSKIGKRTPIFTRFSTVAGEKGSADTVREPRGFAVKFYTEEGNFDAVGNNFPVFFIRDPLKFPDLIHSQKKCPMRNSANPNSLWDFISLVPESLHMVTMLFSDRGIPDGYRHMDGFPGHTYKLVNKKGEQKYVKWHFKTKQGIKALDSEKAAEIAGKDPDYAGNDLFNAIQKGNYPEWTVYIQVLSQEEFESYRFNPLDMTKVISQNDFPLQEVGRFILNRNPENYFAEVEQSAFSPSHLVPGIEPTYDKLLQGRLFAYPDAHRYRLGVNYTQIPINSPKHSKVNNHIRDGLMTVNGNFGAACNYEPNSFSGPKQFNLNSEENFIKDRVSGDAKRHNLPVKDDDFTQPKMLYELLLPQEKQRLAQNIAGSLGKTQRHIQEKMLQNFGKISREYKELVAEELNKVDMLIRQFNSFM